MKIALRRGTATLALALALLGTAAGCSASSSASPKNASEPTSSVSAAATLPALASSADMLVDVQHSGSYMSTTRAVTAGDLTFQVACVGADSTISIDITSQSPSKQLLWSVKQGCTGDSQKAVFNPGAQPEGMQITATAAADDHFEILLSR